MKKEKILPAIFWLGLYSLYTYFFWSLPIHTLTELGVLGGDGVPLPITSAVLMLICGGIMEMHTKFNPGNPTLALVILTFASLVSPGWYVPLGIIALAIKLVKNTYTLIKTANWSFN